MPPRPPQRLLPRPPRLLGVAGVLPPILCILAALADPRHAIAAAIAGGLYAALILSFLGGLWWMEALLHGEERFVPYLLAVMPSLLGWALMVPPILMARAFGPSLTILGLAVLLTPFVDRQIGTAFHAMPGWARLRWGLSMGLGSATLILALLTGL